MSSSHRPRRHRNRTMTPSNGWRGMTHATQCRIRNNRSVTAVSHPTLERNLAAVQERIASACRRVGRSPEEVTLIAVTKSVDVAIVRALVALGQRELGESRPQELWRKHDAIGVAVHWHLIGHLQSNKVRRTAPLLTMLHSLDRWSIAEAFAKDAATRMGDAVPAALEVNLTGESAKHGFSIDGLRAAYTRLIEAPGLRIVGLMTMARFEEDAERCRPTFGCLRELRDELRRSHPNGPALEALSMGMSQDFEVAIEEGATHVRIGTALFEGLRT